MTLLTRAQRPIPLWRGLLWLLRWSPVAYLAAAMVVYLVVGVKWW